MGRSTIEDTVATRSGTRRWATSLFAMLLSLALGLPAFAQETAPTVTLQSLGVSQSGGDVVVELGADERPVCASFSIPNPAQIVITCGGMTKGDTDPVQQVGNGVIDRIETVESSTADGTSTEVRIYLTALSGYDEAARGNTWVVTIRGDGGDSASDEDAIAAAMAEDDSAPASSGRAGDVDLTLDSTRTGELSSVSGDHSYLGGGTQIRGVDFQQKLDAGISRLVVTGSRALDYTTSYPSSNRMVIAVRNSALGSGLERKIDTSKFASAVTGVSAFRSRQVRGEVKVVVDLRESVTPTVTERDNVIIVDFPIPPSIAGAAYQAPETVQSFDEPDDAMAADEGIQGAYSRERLIGASGDVSDPAKAAKARRNRDSVFGGDGTFLGTLDPSHQWKGFSINLNLVRANIHNVFRLLSAVSKLNIVTSDDVDGDVTVQLHEVPWDQALAAILQAKGLGATQYGSIIRVAPIENIRKEREDAAAALQAEEESKPLKVLTIPLNYASADDVMDQLEQVLSKRGSITFDERTNSIIVRDISNVLGQIRELVKTLDTRTPQVHIEARIVEANTNFTRSLGIQWGGNLNFSPATGAPTGLFFPNNVGVSGGQTATAVTAGGAQTLGGRPSNFTTVPNYVVDLPAASTAGSLGLSLGSLSQIINLDARLTAGESDGSGKIISAPSITTVTNRPATIRDGARVPFETASLRGTSVQFIEAVLLLEVTPQITADGTIFLDINLTKNRPDFGAAVRGLPSIQIKEARTTVMVGDGDTTVIGGVYSYEEFVNRSFVPGLGKIPVLGWLFKTTSKRRDRRELLVFITPTIVRTTD